jgi:glutamate synthase domain-containing protein 2
VLGQTAWLDELCEAILQRGIEHAPDFITLDGGDGGTGASPLTLIDCTGLTLKESLPILVDKLIEYNLKDRIKVICSGKLINPAGVAWALCVGADFITSARGFMFSLGCIQALQCNKNTCPTGITTQNKKLQRGLNPADKSVRVANYVERMVDEVNMLAHSCGVTEPHSLRRHHVRIVQANGYSIVMDELNPYPEIRKINL